jgi:glycosyltransferase involved in cell wall biosynthesis
LTPEVSVVIPTHNRKALLALSLRSALRQRDSDLEVVVVDDGSTDGSAEAVERLGDERVYTVRNDPAQGVSVARNRGIHLSRGGWIAFLDDDDLWAPEKLSAQLEVARQTGRGWAYVGSANFSDALKAVGGAPPPSPEEVMARLPVMNSVPGGCSGVIVERATLAASGGFDPGLRPLADWDMWIRIARHGPPACVARPLVGYRVHSGNMSLDLQLMLWELAMVERRYGVRGDRAAFYRHLARLCLRAGRTARALAYFGKAAMRESAYLRGDFRLDTAEILRARIRALRRDGTVAGNGGAGAPENDRYEPFAAWRREAQEWLDDFKQDENHH